MRNRPKITMPRLLVLVGFALGSIGSVVLGLSTFQSQTTSQSGPLGSGAPITLTFTHQGLYPWTVVLVVVLLAFPVVLAFPRWKFYLATLVAPALVALITLQWIYVNQAVGAVVVSSETWVFLGEALVYLGCALEIFGVVRTRFGAGSTPAAPMAHPIRTKVGR